MPEDAVTGVATMSAAMLGAFRRGEDSGVRAAYEFFSGSVFAVAYSVLRDRELASDVVQETFIRAWRARESVDPARGLQPWLVTIARRLAIDSWRQQRRLNSQRGVPVEADSASTTSLDSIWEACQVRLAVERLPAPEQAVVLLHHFEQLSHAEIAALVGIPLGTVKSRSFRAHRRLAQLLGQLHDGSSANQARRGQVITDRRSPSG